MKLWKTKEEKEQELIEKLDRIASCNHWWEERWGASEYGYYRHWRCIRCGISKDEWDKNRGGDK